MPHEGLPWAPPCRGVCGGEARGLRGLRRHLREDVPALIGPTPAPATVSAARRRLIGGALGIAASAAGFGFVFGLSARGAGFSLVEAMAMSVLAFAGAAQ